MKKLRIDWKRVWEFCYRLHAVNKKVIRKEVEWQIREQTRKMGGAK